MIIFSAQLCLILKARKVILPLIFQENIFCSSQKKNFKTVLLRLAEGFSLYLSFPKPKLKQSTKLPIHAKSKLQQNSLIS